MTKFTTKDSGKREEYESGMRRDTQEGKPDFSLIMAEKMPYSEQLLTRWADLMTRGADKYGARNWEKACSEEELARFKASAFRHFMQWMNGETDEDHASAVLFNINAHEYVKWRITSKIYGAKHDLMNELITRRQYLDKVLGKGLCDVEAL
jgi:hypothetical protein